jgi:uncharacterized protein
MSRTITVRMGSVLLAAVAALALVVAYLLGAAGGDGGAASAAETSAGPPAVPGDSSTRTIRMVGRGETTAVPDELTFGLVVTLKRTDLETALDDSSAIMKQVLAGLTPYGVEKADVQTTGLSMNPEYDYHSSGPPTLTGYRVTQQARVEVADLGRAGAAITAAVDIGGNDVRVRNIRLQVADPAGVLAEARAAAVAQARAKAEQYAEATGQQLGDVLSVREISSSTPAPQPLSYRTADLAGVAPKAVPIRAGESDLTVRVEVVWSFA